MPGARGKVGRCVVAAAGAAVFVTASFLLSSCRVGPFVPVRAPFPDGGADEALGGAGEAAASAPCDLLAQDCANQKTCYPVDDRPGVTSCELTGSAPPAAFCAMSLECDDREACVFVLEAGTTLCATLCDPSAVSTGCLPRAICRPIPAYNAGFCVP
jgi:hypothetical protein